MNEDFIPFEIAKKLKEKGFKEKCLAYYDIDDNVGLLYNTQYSDEYSPCQYTDLLQSHNTDITVAQPDDSENCCDAPTISQVLKWLRKEKKIHIVCPFYKDKGFYYYVQRIGNAARIVSSFDDSDTCFDTAELAALAGISYAIDNLI